MKAFAELLTRLAFSPGRNAKLAHLAHYFRDVPDPERGYALAALTGNLDMGTAKPALVRGLVADRVDAELFAMSYDYVGDLAETVALIWPTRQDPRDVGLSEVVEALTGSGKVEAARLIAGWLDALEASERYALIKLVTGSMRVGVSTRMALTALASNGTVPIEEIEELWTGFVPPYLDLFAWVEGGPKPEVLARAPFRPVMLSTPTNEDELAARDPSEYAAEWKWDGIRIQAACEGGAARLYTRTGEDISHSFPDLVERMQFTGTLDGELLVRRDDVVAPFGDLQKRLGRKSPGKALLKSHPAALRLYDVLLWEGEDLRGQPFDARRTALENAVAEMNEPRFDASPLLEFTTWDDLASLRANPPDPVIEGVMLKRRDSVYQAGRPRGPWFKWKRDAMTVDAVLMYAQRGHGKRSGFYSDFTFGLWDGEMLVPVGKAYSGFTDEELLRLDRFVRNNTTERFGPVRSLAPKLAVEVAFEGLNRSTRHKSGVAMRFPRIARIRWDKPVEEADVLDTLKALLPPET